MRRFVFIIIILTGIGITSLIQLNKQQEIKESMIYFPINEKITFESAYTTIDYLQKLTDERYSFVWRVYSKLKEKAYLRQDISLLFVNGRLHDLLGEWKQNVSELSLQKKVTLQETAKIEAISFHHGEIHHQNAPITSSQMMSTDQRYVIFSNHERFHYYSIPNTKEEKEWEQLLNNIINKQQRQTLQHAAKLYSIPIDEYETIPLTHLANFNEEPLLHFSIEQSKKIIGQLWEGIYKNYFLGIKKEDGTIISAINSSVPILLFAKNQSHLLIIFEDATGEIILLRQSL